MADNDGLYSAAGRRAELHRRSRDLVYSGADLLIAGDQPQAVFGLVPAFVCGLAAFDDEIAKFRLQAAESTGKSQPNPYSQGCLKHLANALDEAMDKMRRLAEQKYPEAADVLLVAQGIAARVAVKEFACPHYSNRAAWFELHLKAARQTYHRLHQQGTRKRRGRRRKRQTDSWIKILAALSAHHQPGNDADKSIPASHAELAASAKTSAASVTRFFGRSFGSYSAYVDTCVRDPGRVFIKLRQLADGWRRDRLLATDIAAEDRDFTHEGGDEMEKDFSIPRKSLRRGALRCRPTTDARETDACRAWVYGAHAEPRQSGENPCRPIQPSHSGPDKQLKRSESLRGTSGN